MYNIWTQCICLSQHDKHNLRNIFKVKLLIHSMYLIKHIKYVTIFISGKKKSDI